MENERNLILILNLTLKKTQHLIIIQNSINRMADFSARVKGLYIGFYLSILTLFNNTNLSNNKFFLCLLLISMTIAFLLMDMNFYHKERTLRRLYHFIRLQEDTDFRMQEQSIKEKFLELSIISSIFYPFLLLIGFISIFYIKNT